MKKIIVVLLVLAVLGAALVVMLQPQPPPRQRVELSFLAFTNAADGPRAMLAVTFLPRFGGCAWEELHTWRGGNGYWEEWISPSTRPMFQPISPTVWPARKLPDGKRINMIMTVPVQNTNDGWRLVVKINEGRPGPPAFIAFMRSLWQRARQTPPPSGWDAKGPAYFLTNETRRGSAR
jgi:hypothetical protein